MNKLDTKTRKLIIRCLVEGQSIRSTARTADVSKNTITKLMIAAGKACADYQDRVLHDLPCCPSSKHLGQVLVFSNGGSGSSKFAVKPPDVDVSSGGFGW